MNSFKFKRIGFENYIPLAFCHCRFLRLRVFFSLFPREDMKTWHCKCPSVCSGPQGHFRPPAFEVHMLSYVTFPRHHNPSPRLWNNFKILITANMLTNATEASAARLPVVNLICTWSVHAQTWTHMYTDKHTYTFAENSWEDKTETPAGLTGSTQKSLEMQDVCPAASKRTHPWPCFIRERRRCVLMIEHIGGDAWRLERLTEMGLVVATDPSPRARKPICYKEQSVARKTKGGRAWGRSTYWRCHTRPCSTPLCQSCSCCRHIRRKRKGRTSLPSHQSTSGRSLLGMAPSRLVQSTPLIRRDVGNHI